MKCALDSIRPSDEQHHSDNIFAEWKINTANEAAKCNSKNGLTLDKMMQATAVMVEKTIFAFVGNLYCVTANWHTRPGVRTVPMT